MLPVKSILTQTSQMMVFWKKLSPPKSNSHWKSFIVLSPEILQNVEISNVLLVFFVIDCPASCATCDLNMSGALECLTCNNGFYSDAAVLCEEK